MNCILIGTDQGALFCLIVDMTSIIAVSVILQPNPKITQKRIVFSTILDELKNEIHSKEDSRLKWTKNVYFCIATESSVHLITQKQNNETNETKRDLPSDLGLVVRSDISRIKGSQNLVILDINHLMVITNVGKIIAFDLLSLECVWSCSLDPLIDFEKLSEASISKEGLLGCWTCLSDYRILTISRDLSYLPDIKTRIYDFFAARKWNQLKGIPESARNLELDKICKTMPLIL